MDAIAIAIRNRLEEIGATEELIAKFFEGSVVPEKKVRKAKAKDVKVEVVKVEEEAKVEAQPIAEKSDSESEKKTRSRTVSKKMKEYAGNEGATPEQIEAISKAYKSVSDEELQSKGGDFSSFVLHFLGKSEMIQIKPAKKEKAKKAQAEKAPSRIERWTATLTRQLTKIVEESGGKFDDSIKKQFHAWIDEMSEELFGSAAMEGHMRAFVLEKLAPKPEAQAQAEVPVIAEDDEDMEEVEFEGETLWVGVDTGKIHRETPEGGYLWIGMTGVGIYANVKKPSA